GVRKSTSMAQTVETDTLKWLFPTTDALPVEHGLAAPIHQRRYLVGGRLKTWAGKTRTVLSPVCTRLPDGSVQQVPIGSYPVMGEAESDAALDAAVAAYDSGRGEWPTMIVAGRIARMQAFLQGMAERRETLVKLIMWEIGKSLPDARKEVDRTIEYGRA